MAKKIVVPGIGSVIGLAIFFIFSLFSFTFCQESMTITTYYPSPYGVYKTLRLFPNDDAMLGDDCSNSGEMSYSLSGNEILVCNGSSLKWSVLGGYWAANGSDIYNTNSGKVGIGTSAPNAQLQVIGAISRGGTTLTGITATHVNLGTNSSTTDNGLGFATIGGGNNNQAAGDAATIAGGGDSRALANYTAIGGGVGNRANKVAATVAGGDGNIAGSPAVSIAGRYATVGGGRINYAYSDYDTIAGGYRNVAGSSAAGSDHFATVAGGTDNQALGQGAFIGGGIGNIINLGAINSTIGG